MSGVPLNPDLPSTRDFPLSAPPQNANMLNSPRLSHDDPAFGSQIPTNLDGSTTYSPSSQGKEALPSFSEAVKLGMGGLSGHSVPRIRAEHNVHPPPRDLESTHKVTSTGQLPLHFDLPTMSLFGKIWGDSIPFHLIRVKTKRDWINVKGQVVYVDMGNGWILFKFANIQDREFV